MWCSLQCGAVDIDLTNAVINTLRYRDHEP
jgi:hypothetical protein